MRKALMCIGVLACIPIALPAQEKPGVDVFAGYSFLRTETGEFDNQLNQNGWNVSVAANLARSFGVVADFSNHYASSSPNFAVFGPPPVGNGGKGFMFLFGPQYSYRRVPRVTPFAHALFGGIQGERVVASPSGFTGGSTGLIPTIQSQTAFAEAFGGGLDVKAARHIWVRAFQLDYVRADLFSGHQNYFRLSTGVVYHFGRR